MCVCLGFPMKTDRRWQIGNCSVVRKSLPSQTSSLERKMPRQVRDTTAHTHAQTAAFGFFSFFSPVRPLFFFFLVSEWASVCCPPFLCLRHWLNRGQLSNILLHCLLYRTGRPMAARLLATARCGRTESVVRPVKMCVSNTVADAPCYGDTDSTTMLLERDSSCTQSVN